MSATSGQRTELRIGRDVAATIFSADLRSLAALRIVLALVVLADLAGRATTLTALYTDDGVLPRDLVRESLDS